MVFIFSYQDSGKKRYLELFGENNSNLLSASYLQCPHCQLQLNIDRKRSIHALQALEKVEAARRDVEQKSKFYRKKIDMNGKLYVSNKKVLSLDILVFFQNLRIWQA